MACCAALAMLAARFAAPAEAEAPGEVILDDEDSVDPDWKKSLAGMRAQKLAHVTLAQKSLAVYDAGCVTPFHGHRLIEFVVWIMCDGRVMKRGELTEERGR